MPPREERVWGPSTRAVHAGDSERAPGLPVVTPLLQTTTFYSDPAGGGEVLYTRYGNNPTQRALEHRIGALERAEACHVTGSGMGAMAAAVLAAAKAGDHVLASRDLYGGTRELLVSELSRLGIESSFVDFTSTAWKLAIRPNTRVLLAEIPTNPLLRVVDLRALGETARSVDAWLIVDATFATPMNLRALENGADLVVHSATKYLGGHSDVTAGAVVGSEPRIAEVRRHARIWGAALDPHAAWLLERGIKTLALRMERHNATGMTLATWCERQDGIGRVHYPGLPSHPDHALASELLDGFGGMLSLELEGGGAAAERFVRALRLAKLAPSLGGVETLVSRPAHTSHAAMTAEQRREVGISDGLVRFSLGIEDPEDIIGDLAAALSAAGANASR